MVVVAYGKALDQPPAVGCKYCGETATIIHSGIPCCGRHALRRLEAECGAHVNSEPQTTNALPGCAPSQNVTATPRFETFE